MRNKVVAFGAIGALALGGVMATQTPAEAWEYEATIGLHMDVAHDNEATITPNKVTLVYEDENDTTPKVIGMPKITNIDQDVQGCKFRPGSNNEIGYFTLDYNLGGNGYELILPKTSETAFTKSLNLRGLTELENSAEQSAPPEGSYEAYILVKIDFTDPSCSRLSYGGMVVNDVGFGPIDVTVAYGDEVPSEDPEPSEDPSEEPSDDSGEDPSESDEPDDSSVDRADGANRYQTAIKIAQRYESGVDTVYIATGQNYPDALAAAAIAGNEESPVLLVESNRLDPEVVATIQKLDPDEIVIVGGPGAVSAKVESELKAKKLATKYERMDGANRYATASELAKKGYPAGASVVYLASGQNFPDALSASAAAAYESGPVLLVMSDQLSGETEAALKTLRPQKVVVVGGEGVVSKSVEKAASDLTKAKVKRYEGPNRFATAQSVAQQVFGSGGVPMAVVADGMKFPDALVGAAYAGAKGGPVILTQTSVLNAEAATTLKSVKPRTVLISGGPAAVNDQVKSKIATIINSVS